MDTELYALAECLGALLRDQDLRVATAESCTGGWIAKCLTDVPGASRWFERGFVTYSNAAKEDLLGVDPGTLAAQGAVSEAVVREMALGAVAHSGAEVAMAVSGIAGPGGGTPDKPVGTVWLAWALPGGGTLAERACFPGDREAVRRAAVERALRGLMEHFPRALC